MTRILPLVLLGGCFRVSHWLVTCSDQLVVPVVASIISADGTLDLPAAGRATEPDPNDNPSDPGFTRLYLDGSFPDATLPPGDLDPAEFDNKRTFVTMNYDEQGFLDGAAGWGGEQETEDSKSSSADYLLRLFPVGGPPLP